MVMTLAQVEIFLLILARIGGVLIEAPMFNLRTFPAIAKVSLAIWISVVLWFVVPVSGALPPDFPTFTLAIINELIIGAIIGFIAHVIFAAVQAAGDVMDLQMGLSIATVISPTTGGVVSIVGNLAFMFALTIFVTIDGHHLILSTFKESFRLIPLVTPIDPSKGAFLLQVLESLKIFWLIALQLCAPIVLLIFLTDFSFGIVSRVAPQVNVFMLGFQVKPALGLVGIMLTLPLLSRHIADITGKIGEEVIKALLLLKP